MPHLRNPLGRPVCPMKVWLAYQAGPEIGWAQLLARPVGGSSDPAWYSRSAGVAAVTGCSCAGGTCLPPSARSPPTLCLSRSPPSLCLRPAASHARPRSSDDRRGRRLAAARDVAGTTGHRADLEWAACGHQTTPAQLSAAAGSPTGRGRGHPAFRREGGRHSD